jgi:hypothetical protein
MDQWINGSMDQWINESINQSINQSAPISAPSIGQTTPPPASTVAEKGPFL